MLLEDVGVAAPQKHRGTLVGKMAERFGIRIAGNVDVTVDDHAPPLTIHYLAQG